MSAIDWYNTCLDVAIDHRLKRLCKPTGLQKNAAKPSEHPLILQEYGRIQGRKTAEIKVTSELAGPATTGGIAVTLQQPRSNHPFQNGLEAVIQDCETLKTLDQLFRRASCGTLNIRDNVSVIDLIPFTPGDVDTVPLKTLQYAFEVSRLAICAKRPDVVLCAGKIWLPNEETILRKGLPNQGKSGIKGEMWKLENIGVGRPNQYDEVTLTYGGRGISMSKVNGFHPSYAMNYHPEHTHLKQLLLLNVVKTCGVYRGDWEEEGWMTDLRAECFHLTESLNDERKFGRLSQTLGSLNGYRNLSDYKPIYQSILQDVETAINNFKLSHSQAGADVYGCLLRDKLSYKCNDARVVLRKSAELERGGWLERYDRINRHCLEHMALCTRQFVGFLNQRPLPATAGDLRVILLVALKDLTSCFTTRGSEVTLDLEKAGFAFLQMAVLIEKMLEKLLEANIRHAAHLKQAAAYEQQLIGRLNGLVLGFKA
ncbi:hypothetical protein F5Y19DRAFT_405572 [Xylariaceae sp. FL1651]|nr:hypothetical protein F5Y19DRAFT_405572 [Xylariaceae sp. FL1651]